MKHPGKTLYTNFKHKKKGTYDVTVGATGACDTSSPEGCAGFFGSNPNPNVSTGLGIIDCAWHAHGARILNNRGQCYAQPGYDGVSGVGTPKGLSIFK